MDLCHVCGKRALGQCQRCERSAYCGKECQMRDWHEGGHKRECFDAHSPENGLGLASEVWTDLMTRADDLGEEATQLGHDLVEELAMEHVMTQFFEENPHFIEDALADPEWAHIEVDEEVPESIEARAEALLWLDCHRIGGSIAHDAEELVQVGGPLGGPEGVQHIGSHIAKDYAERVVRVNETDTQWYARMDNAFTDKLRDAWDKVKSGARKAADSVKRGASRAWDATKRGARKAWDAAKRGASKAKDAAKRGLQRAKDAAGRAGRAIKGAALKAKRAIAKKARELKTKAGQKLQQFKQSAKTKVGQLRQKVQQKKQQLKESFQRRRQAASERRQQRQQQRQQTRDQRAQDKAQRDADRASQREAQQQDRSQRDAQNASDREEREAQRQAKADQDAQRRADREAQREQDRQRQQQLEDEEQERQNQLRAAEAERRAQRMLVQPASPPQPRPRVYRDSIGPAPPVPVIVAPPSPRNSVVVVTPPSGGGGSSATADLSKTERLLETTELRITQNLAKENAKQSPNPEVVRAYENAIAALKEAEAEVQRAEMLQNPAQAAKQVRAMY